MRDAPGPPLANQALAARLRDMHRDGLAGSWSGVEGAAHAQAAVIKAGLEDVVEHVLAKPGLIVDDLGMRWLEFVRVAT